MADNDVEAVTAIYNHYVAETVITFEEDAVDAPEMRRRILEVERSELPWLVAERDNEIVGYAYATPWRKRRAYRRSTEVTVYAAPGRFGEGIGSALYTELLSLLQGGGFRVAIGGIALPNAASVALHEKFGFRKVAHFEDVGLKFDRWIDVGYWQLSL